MFTSRRFWVFTCILSALGLITLGGCLALTAKGSASGQSQMWVQNPQDAQRRGGPVEIQLDGADGHAGSGSITLSSSVAGQWHGDLLTVDLHWEHLRDGGLWLQFTCSVEQVKWFTGVNVTRPVTYEAYLKVIDAETAHLYWRDPHWADTPSLGVSPGGPDPKVQPNAHFLKKENSK